MRSLAELFGWRWRGEFKVVEAGRASRRRLLRRRKKRAQTQQTQQAQQTPQPQREPQAHQEQQVQQMPLIQQAQQTPQPQREPQPQQEQQVQRMPLIEQAPLLQEAPHLQQAPPLQQTPLVQQALLVQQEPLVQQVPPVQQAPPVQRAPLVRQAPLVQRAPLVQQSKKTQEAPQAQQKQEQVREAEPEHQSDSGGGGASCVCSTPRATPLPSLASSSDLEDEVFEDEETLSVILPATPPPLHHSPRDLYSHGHHADSVAFPASRRHSKTLPASLLQLPTILVEGQQPQDGVFGHARHRSDSDVASSLTHSAPPSPQSPPRVPEVTFDEHAAWAARARPGSPYFAPKKAPFTVKYTKVYGEGDGAYNNDSRPRGLVFVCNFKYFENNRYSPRVGSEKDFENLVSLFTQMGYNPEHRRRRYCLTGHVTKEEFLQRLHEFAAEAKHKPLCSCVVILMSHGTGPRTFVTSDNLAVDLLDVYKIFDNINCPNLKGKPKVFILQFCRGEEPAAAARQEVQSPGSPGRQARRQVNDELLEKMVKRQVSIILQNYLRERPALLGPGGGDDGLALRHIKEHSRQASLASLASIIQEAESSEDGDAVGVAGGGGGGGGALPGRYEADTSVIAALPAAGLQRYSDMYSIFSTSPGELSHRHPAKGSLLIQAICHVFAEYAYQDDIDTLVRRVSTYMTKTLQRDDPVTVPRQTCERTNNGLDKLFYFNPYEMAQNRQLTI